MFDQLNPSNVIRLNVFDKNRAHSQEREFALICIHNARSSRVEQKAGSKSSATEIQYHDPEDHCLKIMFTDDVEPHHLLSLVKSAKERHEVQFIAQVIGTFDPQDIAAILILAKAEPVKQALAIVQGSHPHLLPGGI